MPTLIEGRPLVVAEKILDPWAGTAAPVLTSPATMLFSALTFSDSGAMLSSSMLPILFASILFRTVVLTVIILLGPMSPPGASLKNLLMTPRTVGTWAELFMRTILPTREVLRFVLCSVSP